VDIAVEGSKRRIRVYSFEDRVAHAALARALNERLEAEGVFLNSSHAYRRFRGVYTALEAARNAQRSGFRFCVSMDVAGCFDSISTGLLSGVLDEYADIVASDSARFILTAFKADLLRRPSHPDRLDGDGPYAPPLNRVLVGSALGPVMCNLVLSRFLDGPIHEELGARVCFLRYADDCLILARTESDAQRAMEVATSSLASIPRARLNLHPEKGTKGRTVHLDETRVPWLGYELHGRRISTPTPVFARWQERLMAADAPTFRAELAAARSQLRYITKKRARTLDAAVARHHPGRRGDVRKAFETRPTAQQIPERSASPREAFYGVLNPLFWGDP
jgi:hypothetical protein